MRHRPMILAAAVVAYLGVAVPYALTHQHPADAVVAPAASTPGAYLCTACTHPPAAAAVQDYVPLGRLTPSTPQQGPIFPAPVQEPAAAPYVDWAAQERQREAAAAQARDADARLYALEQAQKAQQQQADYCHSTPKGLNC